MSGLGKSFERKEMFTFKQKTYLLTAEFHTDELSLHEKLRSESISFPDDTVAYTNDDVIYLLQNFDFDTAAHEATHAALCIMAKSGLKRLIVTDGLADSHEEDLCQLVGVIAGWLIEEQQVIA